MAHSRAVQQLQDVLRFMAEAAGKGPDNALIIDGKALTHALAPDVKALLLEVSPSLQACNAWGDSRRLCGWWCAESEPACAESSA